MTKAEARRMLNCVDDHALAEQLFVAYTTVYRWKRMVPVKYRQTVEFRAKHGTMQTIDVPVTQK